MTPSANPPSDRDRRRFLVQAPVPPIDTDGVKAMSIGTALFAIAAVIMLIDYHRLSTRGDAWWLAVAVSGAGIGVIGLGYALFRRRSAPGDSAQT